MEQRALFERDFELVALRAACVDAVAGRGAMVAVRGAAGIGKTALLDAARRTATDAGLDVLAASGAELERELAFGIVRQLFERPLRAMPEALRGEILDGAAGLATPVLVPDSPSSAPPDALHAATHGLYWLAAELAARTPLLLVVDDVQWADAASLRWLAYLARRLDGVPLLLLVACRDAEPGADSDLVEQALAEAQAHNLRPRPLSREAVESWLAGALDRAPAGALVDACWERTGGNPFLLRELTAELRTDRLTGDAEAVGAIENVAPATIARSVLLRLVRSGEGATAVAEAVAVLSLDARLDLVAGLSGLTLAAAAEIVDRLAAIEILAPGEPITFAHPVLRTAVYEQIARVRRGLAHAAAARMLLDEGAGPERAATHLLLTPAAGDLAVVEALRSAGAIAIARGAPEAAVPLLRRALAEPPRERAEVLFELARAESLAQDPAAIQHARAVVATASAPLLGTRGALLAADMLMRNGRNHDALATLAAVDDAALDGATRRDLQATALMIASFTNATALDASLTALGVDTLPGDTAAERTLLALRVMDLILRACPREAILTIARRVAEREDPAAGGHEFALAVAARAICLADEIDEARAIGTRVIEAGRRRGAIGAVAFGCHVRADVELRAGRLAEAEADAREALALAQGHALWLWPAALSHLIHALADREPPDVAFAALTEYDLDFDVLPPSPWTPLLFHARGRLRAEAGDVHGAAQDFTSCGALQQRWGDNNPARVPWRSSLGLALNALDRTNEAAQLIQEEFELATHFGAPRAIGVALRARALLHHGEAVVAGLEEAVGVLAAGPARLEHARALVDLGAALRRIGRRADARGVLRSGLDAADRCGAHQLAARARSELTTAGARPRRERISGPESLTASERRVADMAADGLTNRQVAQALFVTTKTVEMHLARVYAKLEISGRGQLRAGLDQ